MGIAFRITFSIVGGVVLSVALVAVVGVATNPRPPAPPVEGVEAFSRYLDEWTTSGAAPSVVAAAIVDGRLVYSKGGGTLLPTTHAEPTVDSIYNWWSITKVFTAVAVMQLAEGGAIDLDRPITTVLPWLTTVDPIFDSVTPQQLLSHTSGLPDNIPEVFGWTHLDQDEEYDQTQYLRDVIADYARETYPPESRHSYSNVGYMILGAAIEAASQESYLDYVEREVVRRAGLERTAFRLDRIANLDPATAAVGSHLVWRMETPFLYLYYPDRLDSMLVYRTRRRLYFREIIPDSHPPTGLRGSAGDLLRFADRLLAALDGDDTLIAPESARRMFRPHLPHKAADLTDAIESRAEELHGDAYGFAFRLQAYRGTLVARHSGGGPGFNTDLWLLPEHRAALVLFASDTRVRLDEIMTSFVDALIRDGLLSVGVSDAGASRG